MKGALGIPGRMARALPATVRRFAGLIIVAWVILAIGLNVTVPQLEKIVADRSPALLDPTTKSGDAILNMIQSFGEGASSNNVYVALESDNELGPDARKHYQTLLGKLRTEPSVTRVIDLWSDPLTSAANESPDRKMAYVQLWLRGEIGDSEAARSVDAVKKVVESVPAPDGLKVYVAGFSAITVDELHAADRDILIISALTFVLIFTVLLLVYRSFITALMPLISVGLALAVARPVISLLGIHDFITASMFASSLSAALILGAGTDYTIFFLGRYHESTRSGMSLGRSYFVAYRGVNHVVVASSLTIAGACACLYFAQIGVLQTAGIPSAIGMLITLLAALTLTPAMVTVLSARGYLKARSTERRDRAWRRFGVTVVRWPVPTFIASVSILGAIAALVLPTMRVSYDEVRVQPDSVSSVQGTKAFDRHFPPNQSTPEIVTVTSDRDLRNPSGAIAVEEVSRALARIPDVHTVVSLTRPTGRLLAESLLINQAGTVALQLEQGRNVVNTRLAELKETGESISAMVAATSELQAQIAQASSGMTDLAGSAEKVASGVKRVEESTARVTNALEPLRRSVKSNRNCAADGMCRLAKSVLDVYDASPVPGAIAGLKESTEGVGGLTGGTRQITEGLSASGAKIGEMVEHLRNLQSMTGRFLGTAEAFGPQLDQASSLLKEIGRNYGASESGLFYLPEQVFSDPRFALAVNSTMSQDGKTARFIVYGRSPAFEQGGIDRAYELRRVASEAVRVGRLNGAVVRVGGTSPTFVDIKEIVRRDFIMLVIVTFLFILAVILWVLRSLVAAIVVVSTVALSFATAMALSVLVWQHVLDHPLHWATPPLAFIALVAVGSDYNLMFASRFREESIAGIKVGIIRSFAGTGTIVTTAGIVFASTMFALLGSSLTNIMQMGSTVGLGLLLDTFVIRAIVLPAIASHLGVWFWWPISRAELRSRRVW